MPSSKVLAEGGKSVVHGQENNIIHQITLILQVTDGFDKMNEIRIVNGNNAEAEQTRMN